MNNQKRLRRIVFYVDGIELAKHLNSTLKDFPSCAIDSILDALKSCGIYGYDVETLSKDEAETFELG